MDPSKAFDMHKDRNLVNKLQLYGIQGTPLKWFICYLSNKTRFVNVRNLGQTPKLIIIGVPKAQF